MMAEKEHTLSNEEVMRYSRQILVQEFGVQGQEKLRSTSLLIVGAGGLGCPVALYCAGAGVGRIGIVDGDSVSSNNLHRQIAYHEHSVGQSKAESLKSSVKKLNSSVRVDVYKRYLSKRNALDIVSNYDIVADCTDNVSASCVLFFPKTPKIGGSAVRWDGQLSVYGYGEDCPCYRCLFPKPPPMDAVTKCSENGVLGPVVGVIGSMQASEIIKIAAIKKSCFAGFLYLFNALNGTAKTVKLRRQKVGCAVCGKDATITKLIDYKELYGHSSRTPVEILAKNDRIDPYSYFKLSENNEKKPFLIDTRRSHEFSIGHLPDAINIPMLKLCCLTSTDVVRELGTDINEMRDKGVYVICRRGEDSQIAVLYLRKEFADSLISFKDIDGGYEKWSHVVDRNFPIY
uniref:Rhodanese domain-containing protein n=1 Tax=Loa loa TaxID=7209 RepID=A0A1I7VVN7_LOALO